MERIAVVNGIRTPFTKMGTFFHDTSAQELGRIVTRELLERTDVDPREIDEVIFGNVCQPPDAANIARVISLLAGIPRTTPAFTVHRNCASGMEAPVQAMLKIWAGQGSAYLVGGAESMSNVPFYFSKQAQDQFTKLSRSKTAIQKLQNIFGFRAKHFSPKIGLQMGLTDPVCGLNMGQTAEVLAKEFGITRQEQDEFSLMSHVRTIEARDKLREEIVPVIPAPKFKNAVDFDNGAREGQTIEALAKLKPFFDRRSGTVTAGNASQITDGAAALLLMPESKVKEQGLKPLGYIRDYQFVGVEPHRMGIGPAHAIPQLLRKAKVGFDEIGLFEINEAFAAQVLACLRSLESKEFAKNYGYEGFTGEISLDILNVNGGAIALGHPVGTTGTRMILTLLKEMHRRDVNKGVASLCIGGGQGAAVLLERE